MSATKFVFANNGFSQLAIALAPGDTSLTLKAGTGDVFPNPGANEQFAITLQDEATGTLEEIVYCTGRVADVLTIVRAQEGTTALAWAVGDYVQNFVTAGTAAAFNQGAGLVTTVASLPSAASNQGLRAMVTDSTVVAAGNFGAVVVGTGADAVPVYSDGAVWRIG